MAAYSDSFTRANSTTSIGGSWTTAGTGNWGIVSNAAYAASGGTKVAVFDTASATHAVTVTVSSGVAGGQAVVVRYVDTSNYVYITPVPSVATWNVRKIVAGVDSLLGNIGLAAFYGLLTVRAIGTRVHVRGPNQQTWTSYTIADAALQSGTKAGLRWGTFTPVNPANTFDDATVAAIDSANVDASVLRLMLGHRTPDLLTVPIARLEQSPHEASVSSPHRADLTMPNDAKELTT